MAQHSDKGFTVGAFAVAAGVNVETIRFYQRRGLIHEPPRVYGQVRRYEVVDVERVRFIKSAQGLGFSLDEIMGLLHLQNGTHCDEAKQAAEEKLSDVRLKLDQLTRIEAALSSLVRQCSATPAKAPCPLIHALQSPPLCVGNRVTQGVGEPEGRV